MKIYQSVLIAGFMAMGLAACSSTDLKNDSAAHAGPTGTQDVVIATDRTNGSNGGGADNSMGNNAGTGNSGAAANGH
jgi:hypothetical protein